MAALFPEEGRRGPEWWSKHSLSIVLIFILVFQTAFALWSGYRVWSVEGEKVNGPFWIWWSWGYNVSLVADSFGVLLIVMLSKWLYEKGSEAT